ncbi:MAG: Xaa-Pro peptidase family protein [Actinomycetota bacterium]|jgi:Xaa-Pro aminopeptidase|nr:Xaa-Pro peptidase family protein [Actinomycetota bacterium]
MTADLASRTQRVKAAMAAAGVSGLVVTPGSDLRYLTGYAAKPLERLTALVLPAEGDPRLVVPLLELAEAERSPAALAGMDIDTHSETDDAYAIAMRSLEGAERVGVDDHMWAQRVFLFQDRYPDVTWQTAGRLLADLRMRKGSDETASLRHAGAAIDRVHRRMGEFLAVGRTERQVATAVAEAIVAEGHATADFVIVGSGPNSASSHHSVSDRVIETGDTVVVDIGGTTSEGYCSDSTRTYAVGIEPAADVLEYYEVLREAQRAQCDYARPGVTAESVDRVGRTLIDDAGYGQYFVHRTGHGIGLDTHEEPYIVEGNTLVLEPGMAFSIEPGIYLPGRHGARIEDIVVTTDDGIERLNTTPRSITVVAG